MTKVNVGVWTLLSFHQKPLTCSQSSRLHHYMSSHQSEMLRGGGSRLHHLACCLPAATPYTSILATRIEEGLAQAAFEFQLVISEEWCVCELTGIMDECWACWHSPTGKININDTFIPNYHSATRMHLTLSPCHPHALFHHFLFFLFLLLHFSLT